MIGLGSDKKSTLGGQQVLLSEDHHACGGGCSTRICCCHAACIVQLFAAANVIPLSVLVGLLLHTVDISISRTDGVSSSKPIGVREAGTILPDKGFVHCNVVQADPCIRAHHAGDQIIFG